MEQELDSGSRWNDMIDLNEVAHMLSVSRRTVERLIKAGDFPKPVKIGRASRVRDSDVQDYLSGKFSEREEQK